MGSGISAIKAEVEFADLRLVTATSGTLLGSGREWLRSDAWRSPA